MHLIQNAMLTYYWPKYSTPLLLVQIDKSTFHLFGADAREYV